MADSDKLESQTFISNIGNEDRAAVVEESLTELEGISVLDFDLLCSTVALQTQGKWKKLESSEGDDTTDDEYNVSVLRLWEGDVMNCLEDRYLCMESACCPCYRFGKNMTRSGFGSCFLQGVVHMILIVCVLVNVTAFIVTKKHSFLYLAIAFVILVVSYLGFFRMQIRRKFNIRGDDSFFDDCIHHLVCPFCTLTQESKTLEMNNVHEGTWHGRGDTLCIEGKPFIEVHSPPVVVSKMSSEP